MYLQFVFSSPSISVRKRVWCAVAWFGYCLVGMRCGIVSKGVVEYVLGYGIV